MIGSHYCIYYQLNLDETFYISLYIITFTHNVNVDTLVGRHLKVSL